MRPGPQAARESASPPVRSSRWETHTSTGRRLVHRLAAHAEHSQPARARAQKPQPHLRVMPRPAQPVGSITASVWAARLLGDQHIRSTQQPGPASPSDDVPWQLLPRPAEGGRLQTVKLPGMVTGLPPPVGGSASRSCPAISSWCLRPQFRPAFSRIAASPQALRELLVGAVLWFEDHARLPESVV